MTRETKNYIGNLILVFLGSITFIILSRAFSTAFFFILGFISLVVLAMYLKGVWPKDGDF